MGEKCKNKKKHTYGYGSRLELLALHSFPSLSRAPPVHSGVGIGGDVFVIAVAVHIHVN
jgi:hypothetical protein